MGEMLLKIENLSKSYNRRRKRLPMSILLWIKGNLLL